MASAGTDFEGLSGELEGASSDWERTKGRFIVTDVSGNDLAKTGSTTTHCYSWLTNTFNDDQYSQGVLKSSAGFVGVAGRISGQSGEATGDTNAYLAYASNAALRLMELTNDSATQLAEDATVYSVDDVIRLECEGTTISVQINSSEKISQTDSTHASGYTGITGVWNSTSYLDDWEGGDLAAAVSGAKNPLGHPFKGPFAGPIG